MDLTRLWVITKTKQTLLLQVVCGLLLLAVGWQLGRTMSPYYNAQPIVFEDRQCENCASSGGSVAELQALRDEGIRLAGERTPDNTTAPVVSTEPTTTPAVAGVSTEESTNKVFAGSKNSDKYHHVSCPDWKRIKEENVIWWPTKEAAEAAGYSPSKCTQEKI